MVEETKNVVNVEMIAIFTKQLSGEPLTEKEVEKLVAHTKVVNKARNEGRREADRAAKKEEADKVYVGLLDAHKKVLAKYVQTIVNGFAKKQFETNADLKVHLQSAIKDMPAAPKKPGARNGSGSVENFNLVEHIAEGSTNWHIMDLLAKKPMNAEDLHTALKVVLPTKSEITLKATVYKGFRGRLPIVKNEKGIISIVDATGK